MSTRRRTAILAVLAIVTAWTASPCLSEDTLDGWTASASPTLSLAALGYQDGVAFDSFSGKQDLFFSVPAGAWLKGLRLVLPYEATVSGEGNGTLTVVAGNHVLIQQAITGNGSIDVPVPLSAIAAGTLQVTLLYSSGERPSSCEVPHSHFRFGPAGGLLLDIASDPPVPVSLASVLVRKMPVVVLPASPTPAQSAAALTTAAALPGTVFNIGGSGAAGNIEIGAESDPALRSVGTSGTPGLSIGGPDPAAAARAVFSPYSSLFSAAVVDRVTLQPKPSGNLQFADLGAASGAKMIADEGGWVVTLPSARLPAGTAPQALYVALSATANGAASFATVSTWMNGVLLGSTPLNSNGITRLQALIPDNTVSTFNTIEVKLDRQKVADCSAVDRGWPAQLLGSSEIITGSAGPVEQFHEFATAAGSAVTVVIPDASALPLAAKAVAGLLTSDTEIKVSYGTVPPEGPVLLIGNAPPANAKPPLQAREGRFVLRSGPMSFDLPDDGTQTVAQLIADKGRPLLWIRPASQGVVPAKLWLDRGDIAIVSQDGSLTPVSSKGERLTAAFVPPEPPLWADWQNMWNSKWAMAAAGAILALLIVIWSFGSSVKRSKPGQGA